MWMILIFHVSEHIWTLFTISRHTTLSQINSNEIFHTIWECVLPVYWSSCNSQPSGEANLAQVGAQMSRQDPSKGGGFAVYLQFKDGPWLKFCRQKQRHETHRDRERGGGDSLEFLSSLVSACTDAGHHTAAAAAASLWILGSPWSGSLKITYAINKQTEAITGRQRRGIGLGQDERRSHWSLNWWAAALQRQQRYQSLLTDPHTPTACSDTGR